MLYLIFENKNMKYKKIQLLVLFTFCFGAYAHSQDSIVESELICKTVDEFTDEVSVNSVDALILYEDGGDMKTEGMSAMGFLREEKGKIVISTFYVQVLGIKGCIDKGSTLDVIFENGKKTQLINYKDFDCNGKNYFAFNPSQLELFKSSNIKAVKYTNKRNYDSMIVKTNIDSVSGSYLRNLLLEIDKINNGELSVKMCE
jgi:hypothetical protein